MWERHPANMTFMILFCCSRERFCALVGSLAAWGALLGNKRTGVHLLNTGRILLTAGEMNRDSTTPTTGLRFLLWCSPEQEKLPGFSTELLPETDYFQTTRVTANHGFYKHEPRHSDHPGGWAASLSVLSWVSQEHYIAGAFEISSKQRLQ